MSAELEQQQEQPQELKDQGQPESPTEPTNPSPEPPVETSLDALSRGIEAASEQPEVPTPDPAPEPPPAAEQEPTVGDTETETEIATLGLKGKAEARFRELAAAKRELSEEVSRFKVDAGRVQQWEAMIQDTGATPEQYGGALGYLKAVNSGDLTMMSQAFDTMQKEMAWLAKQLGRELPGVVDPLDEHADLKKAIEDGDTTRTLALEVAQLRAQQQRARQSQEQAQQLAQKQTEEQQKQAKVQAELNELDKVLRADPLYQEKVKAIDFAWIKANIPASSWAAAIEREFARVVVAPPAPAKPVVGHVPLRPVGRSNDMQAVPKSSMEALEMGFQKSGAL